VKVVATDKAGATAQDVFTVLVLDPTKSTVTGTVMKGTTPVTGGVRVVLFVKDGAMFTALAQTNVSSAGVYNFYNVGNGTYLVKAEITDAVLNPGVMHTYHTSAVSVTGATQIVIAAAGTKTADITLAPSVLPAGTYKISGKVVKKTGNPDMWKMGQDVPSTPAAGVDMVLKQNGVVVANTVTGTDGTYEFASLPEGEYDVIVDVAGYTQQVNQKVTVNAANPVKDNVNFTLWTYNNDHIITSVPVISEGLGIKLYPNPTQGRVNILLSRKDIRETEVSVYNMSGAEIFRKKYFAGENIVFDLTGKVSGIYMVKISVEGVPVIHKLVLDRK